MMSSRDFSVQRICNFFAVFFMFTTFSQCEGLGMKAFRDDTYKADFTITAFLSLHQNSNRTCGTTRETGLYFAEALSYAVDNINKDEHLLVNTTLGVQIWDTCNNPEMALPHALQVVNRVSECNSGDRNQPSVLGVITDHAFREPSNLLGIFNIPQIDIETASVTTQTGGKDTRRIEAILKGVYTSKALLDIVEYFSWSSVSVVFSETFHLEVELLKQMAEKIGGCFAVFESMSKGVFSVLNTLLSEANSRVVILYTEPEDTQKLLTVVRRTQRSQTFTWILSGAWNMRTMDGFEDAFDGSLGLKPEYPFMEDFYQFMKNSEQNSTHQSWKPSVQETLCDSSSEENLNCTWKAEDLQSVINSVFLFANSLNKVLERGACVKESFVSCIDEIRGSNLVNIIGNQLINISDNIFFGNQLFFKETRFSVFNFQKRSLILKATKIGSWEGKPLVKSLINKANIKWKHGVTHIPQSSCGPSCPLGHIRVPTKGRKCCWYCKPCNYNQFVMNNYTCVDCKRGYWPTNEFDKCGFFWGFAIFNGVMYMLFAVSVFIFVAI